MWGALFTERVRTSEAVERTPPALRRAVGLSLAETLAQIHAVDLQPPGLAELASRKPYAKRQVRQWHDSRTRDAPLVEQLAERLARGARRSRR